MVEVGCTCGGDVQGQKGAHWADCPVERVFRPNLRELKEEHARLKKEHAEYFKLVDKVLAEGPAFRERLQRTGMVT